MGLHNSHDANNAFPPIVANGYCDQPSLPCGHPEAYPYSGPYKSKSDYNAKITFFYCLLPYIEQGNRVTNAASNNSGISVFQGNTNELISTQPIKTYTSPTDDSPADQIQASWGWFQGGNTFQTSLSSYVPNARVFGKMKGSQWNYAWDGYGGGAQKMTGISDGTSNTLFVIEKNRITGPTTVTWLNYSLGNASAGGYNSGANTWANTDTAPEVASFFGSNCYQNNNETGNWYSNSCTQTINNVTAEFFQTPRPRRPRTQQNYYNIYPMTASGVQVLMGDGSVRSVSSTVDYVQWSAAVTPAGGEVATLE